MSKSSTAAGARNAPLPASEGAIGASHSSASQAPFLSHYTQCDLPPRAFTQYVSKVIALGGGGGGGASAGSLLSSGGRHAYTRQQIDRGYVIAFEGDNAFNTIVTSSLALERRRQQHEGRRAAKVSNTVIKGGNVKRGRGSVDAPTTSTANRLCEEDGKRTRVEEGGAAANTTSAHDDDDNNSTINDNTHGGDGDDCDDDGSDDAISDDDEAAGLFSNDGVTSCLTAMANCRIVSFSSSCPRAAACSKPLRLIMTTTQLFPQQRLVCCLDSIERSRDELEWAARRWAMLEKEEGGGYNGIGGKGGEGRSDGADYHDYIDGNTTPSLTRTIVLSSAAIRRKHALLSTPIPVGPYWPRGFSYYHGIGETHRDDSGLSPTAGADAAVAVGSLQEEEERSSSTAMLAYPYNMLRLQPCPRMGEGQLEVVAAAPIPAYTAFAYTGPVCDKNAVSTKDSPYFLTLRTQTTVLGQSITRYFNHRYRCDAFGNAQFSSVSIPIRQGMVIEVRGGESEHGTTSLQESGDGQPPPPRKAARKKAPSKKPSKSVGAAHSRSSTPPPPPSSVPTANTVVPSSSSSSSSAAFELMNMPFFITTRDIGVGEPILATSYGTAYDAQLERDVFGAGKEGGAPLPPYLQAWWRHQHQQQQQQQRSGGALPTPAPPPSLPPINDYEGEFRWDIRAGDLVVRVLGQEELDFFATGADGNSGGSTSSSGVRVFVVRDVDAEANVFLIAPLLPSPREDEPDCGDVAVTGGGDVAAQCRRYTFPSSDAFRAIVHFSTIAPLYEEGDYVAVRSSIGGVGRGQRHGAAASSSAQSPLPPITSIVLKERVAQMIAAYPAPCDPEALRHSLPCSLGGGMGIGSGGGHDVALDGCLWPLFAGHTAEEAVGKRAAERRDPDE